MLKITVNLNFDRLSFRSTTFKPLKVSPNHEYSTRTDKGYCVIFLTWKVLPRQQHNWFESFKYFGNKKFQSISYSMTSCSMASQIDIHCYCLSFVWIPDWIEIQVDYAIWDFYWKLFSMLEAKRLKSICINLPTVPFSEAKRCKSQGSGLRVIAQNSIPLLNTFFWFH